MDLLIAPYTVTKEQADTAPVTGTPGWATDGNPATNKPATQWPAYAFNAVQEELLNVIAKAGLVPNRGNNSQLAMAISTFAGGAGSTQGLRAQNNPTTPNSQFDIAADMAVLRDPSNGATRVFAPVASVTANLLTAGPAVNGRDQAAAFPASSWVHFYLISNGSAVASIASLAAPPTGPAMPAGHTMWAYVAAVRLGASSNLSDVSLQGNSVFYRSPSPVLNGTATTNTPFSTSALVPPNASEWGALVQNLAVSASGSGNYSLTLFVDNYQAGMSGIGSASSVYSISGGQSWLPNRQQVAEYRLNVMAGTGPSTTILVYGYKVQNGG